MSKTPITREQITYELAEVLRVGHDSAEREEEQLINSITELTDFYFETSKITEIPYQYRYENQSKFQEHASVVSKALATVEPVLSDMKTRLYKLEKGVPTSNPIIPEQQITSTNPEEKKPIISIPSLRKKGKPDPNLPFQSSLELQRRTEKLIVDWELVLEYQAFGVDLVEDMDYEGMHTYLGYHRNLMRWAIIPNLLRIFKQGTELKLEKEKILALQAVVSNQKEMFLTRMDQPPSNR